MPPVESKVVSLDHDAVSLSLHGTLKRGIAAGAACVDYLKDSTVAGFQDSPLEATYARFVILLITETLEAADWAAGLLDSDAEDRRSIRHH